LAGVDKALDLIETGFPELSKRMWGAKRYVENALVEAGFNLTNGRAPITSIKAGDITETIRLAKKFWDARVMTTPFVYPSVPPTEGRIRLIAGANMREETLRRVKDAVREMNR
jgi:7-keto-8-aminopelargonate synthetase-like enzyme